METRETVEEKITEAKDRLLHSHDAEGQVSVIFALQSVAASLIALTSIFDRLTRTGECMDVRDQYRGGI